MAFHGKFLIAVLIAFLIGMFSLNPSRLKLRISPRLQEASKLQNLLSSIVQLSPMNGTFIDVARASMYDRVCTYPFPKCLNPSCSIWLSRIGHDASCGDGLCPCHKRRTAIAFNVSLSVALESKSRILIIGFKEERIPQIMRKGAYSFSLGPLDSGKESWALIDATTSELKGLPCFFGETVTWRYIFAAAQEILKRKKLSHDFLVPRENDPTDEEIVDDAEIFTNASCLSYPLADENSEVFYAMDPSMLAPGHALDSLLLGIAQYFMEGHNQRGIPWLVPCGDKRLKTPIWTAMFFELNAVLRMPYVLFDIDSLLMTPKVFRVVRFTSFALGWNQECFRPSLATLLWPHALKVAESLVLFQRERFIHVAANGTLEFAFPKSIAFLKIFDRAAVLNGVVTSWARAFRYDPRFMQILQQRGVEILSPTLPLLERMWHVNSAELIVVTWGSTLSTTIAFLLPRRSKTRVLVLVHPGYCYEAYVLLGFKKKKACKGSVKIARRQSKVFCGGVGFVDGAINEFAGTSNFSIKYLFVASLRQVRESDFDFGC